MNRTNYGVTHSIRSLFVALLFMSTLFALLSPARVLAMSTQSLVALTNQQRAEAGLSPLTENAELMASAQAKANDMIARDYWAHFAPDGTSPWYFITQSGYKYKGAGENLAMDFTTDEATMTGWMNSPTHRANILNAAYQEIGIAVVEGVLQGHETTLVVAHYGTPLAAPVPVPSPAVAAATPPAPLPVAAPVTNAVPTSFANKAVQAPKKTLTILELGLTQAWLTPVLMYLSPGLKRMV